MQPSMPFSPVKDGRRILGEKDSNACLSPAHAAKQSLLVAGTPVKRTLCTAASPKKLLPSPIFAGQKRTRDQVDETDVNNTRVQEPRGLREESSPSTKHASQQLTQESDAMEIRVPTSSQPERDQTPKMETNRSRSASRGSDSDTRSVPEEPQARKVFIQEKAALLRNKLQTAMRNVADHQIDRRVSELEAHSRKVPRLSFSTLSSPSTSFRNAITPSQLKTPRRITQSTPNALPPHPWLSYAAEQPPATVVRHGRREMTDGADPEEGPTSHDDLSPSQRGDAVDGLLKLMSTSDRQDNPDAWSG
ncbi:uncharacterized protein N7482_000535 [Penicillium canariense]|uniref:Uncharacterized protein n=1 Tax=Penicillium canariense TaxID=189055 RepID=A0A9W9IDJ2_9EURO|nr:uncharacterized protein N7482_000535 [Penicillium canariense]KAJ5174658.1 hypothetical protein N7482_000535 [Penicillium canariense]